ncbi:rna-directed dna polymerase from mobile element jockey-like protein [Lasius niger]|uniref:Rna-directed dna polymerase from mobile element jockey-like protein n=1 Tax=Lasius niger TaxID=67767 RepID=A0A0J7MND7_LASNI|nr:rna-directed dna polymerase from mobile element jockey-like protein [Lasius niger]
MYGFFMDLKAAFDRVDRKRLWEAMEKRGVRRGLTEKVKEIYESTKCAVRSQGRRSEWFLTGKGVRQGCPLSPLLFSILIADVEEEMKKGQVGGVLVGKERIWTLAYADDLVILAKSEEGMEEMLKRMERFLKRKKLQLNTEK